MMDTPKVELQEAEGGSYAITALSFIGLGSILAGLELLDTSSMSIAGIITCSGLIISGICLVKSRQSSHPWLTQAISIFGMGLVLALILLTFLGMLLLFILMWTMNDA